MSRFLYFLIICLAIAAPVSAQQKEPLPRFAADVRGMFARHKVEPDIAKGLTVENTNLPVRSLGLVGGAHFYPWGGRKVTMGFGGNIVLAHGSRTLETVVEGEAQPVKGPTVRRHFTAFSPEISLNFGHRNGWSYISGGFFGRSKLYLDRLDSPATEAPYRKTLNYGGGARWFTTDHVALSVDFRWYSVAEQLPTTTGVVFQPRTTLLVLSGGIAIK
jgi:hypothetical protein